MCVEQHREDAAVFAPIQSAEEQNLDDLGFQERVLDVPRRGEERQREDKELVLPGQVEFIRRIPGAANQRGSFKQDLNERRLPHGEKEVLDDVLEEVLREDAEVHRLYLKERGRGMIVI